MVLPFQGNADHLSSVHPEQALGVLGGVKFLELFFPFPGNVRNGQTDDLVDTIVLDLLTVKGNQVVVLIVPHQTPGTDLVPGAVAAELLLFADGPLKVLKTDLTVGVDCLVQHIDVVVDALIHGLDPVGDQHLAMKMLGFMDAHHGLQLLDQFPGFLFRDEFG